MKRVLTLLASVLMLTAALAQDSSLPEAARGVPLDPDKGYYVGELGSGLYFVTEGVSQAMFLVTTEGVVVVDAPPSLGENIQKAVAEVTSIPITHVIYSHSHLDHIGMAGALRAGTIIAHEITAAQLERAGDPRVPLPTMTFSDSYILEVGGQTLQLSYHGPVHEPGNIFVYAPAQKTLMVVDLVYPGWVPYKGLAASEDIPAWIAAHDVVLGYDFETYLGGHLGRPGTRRDVETARDYVTDVQANAARALQEVSFEQIAQQYGFQNPWRAIDAYIDEVVRVCAEAVVPAWEDRLGGAADFTASHCSAVEQSLRIELGLGDAEAER